MCFLLKPATKKAPKDRVPVYDIVFSAISASSCAFLLLNYNELLWRPVQWLGFLDKFFAVALVVLVLEASRRCVGITFPILGAAFFFYAYFGPIFGPLGARSFESTLFTTVYSRWDWGPMVGISATKLHVCLWGHASQTGGARHYITIGDYDRQGAGRPAKVVSRAAVWMISGAMATWLPRHFTIPLMKESGYKSEWAAAIEAVSSTGGQIMPPIMGSAAFIMAQILGINYLKVAIAAAVPAVLYYYGAFVAVHYISKRDNIRGKADGKKVSISELLIIFVPIAIFLFFLIRGYSVTNWLSVRVWRYTVLCDIYVRDEIRAGC
jgi:TRAP-type uncharacterized transport system fused permease subunit